MIGLQIYLASQSPRRRALIEQLGIHYQTLDVDVDESPQPGEIPADFVTRLALEKARAGWQLVAKQSVPVVGADTCILLDQHIVGKPENREEGIQLLKRYSGRAHQVVTGIAIVGPKLGQQGTDIVQHVRINTSTVTFRVVTNEECEQYWETGEPIGKAGGYAIQGKAAIFIEKLEGSYTGVMGLPLCEFAELISLFGIKILDAGHGIKTRTLET
ncbi:Maf family protein [Kaarinaea lacus]